MPIKSRQKFQTTSGSPSHDNIWQGSPSHMESAVSWNSMMERLSRGNIRMSGESNQGSPTTPNSPSHNNIRRGSPGQWESAESWNSMVERLHLQSAPPGERTASRHLPFGRQQQLSLRERASSYQFPSAQPQPPTLREQTSFRQVSHEQPPRPPTRPSDRNDSPRSRATAPATNPFFRQTSQPQSIINPPSRLKPPSADLVAAYLAVFEARPRPKHPSRPSRRNCSIIVQCHARSDKFREFCCIPAPHHLSQRQVRFYSSPEIPDPRLNAPGLLDMHFIGWIPHSQLAQLDSYMVEWRGRADITWNHHTWIGIYLETLVREKLITRGQMTRAMIFQDEILHSPYTEDLPNRRQCFPHLY